MKTEPVQTSEIRWDDLASRSNLNVFSLLEPGAVEQYDGPVNAEPRQKAAVQAWKWRFVSYGVFAVLICQAVIYAQAGPQPPCGNEPVPPYPGMGDSANVKSWSRSNLGLNWKPPGCTGWTALGFTTLVTTDARFPHTSEVEGLLRHFGAISGLAGMRYWSTSQKEWKTLVVKAYALTGPRSGERRADFTSDEMKEGADLYYEQVDNRSGKEIYRMHVAEASADRVVIEVENVSTIRYFYIPLFRPGEMQSIYFLDRESENVWQFYSIVRTGKDASRLVTGNESSAVNRAVAFYRYMVGIPTAQEPPAAP